MGYTIENKKIVIWTVKWFSPEKYPFHHEGVHWTRFYKNLRSNESFTECRSIESQEFKTDLAAKTLGLNASQIILRSKHLHYKKRYANEPKN